MEEARQRHIEKQDIDSKTVQESFDVHLQLFDLSILKFPSSSFLIGYL